MKYSVSTLLFTLISLMNINAQNINWSANYGGSNDECVGYGYESRVQSCLDNSGNIYFCTSSESNDGNIGVNYGDRDVWVMKLSPDGDSIWSVVLGGSHFDVPTQIKTHPEGGIIITGYTYSDDGLLTGHHGDTGDTDAFICKMDNNGNIEWVEQYGGSEFMAGVPAYDYLYDFIIKDNGNILAVGQTNSQNGDLLSEINMDLFYTGWILEVNTTGDIVDTKKMYRPLHNESNPNLFFRIAESLDETGYLLMGESQHPLVSADEFWLRKIDYSWNTIWDTVYGCTVQNISKAMCPTSNGGMLISGTVNAANGDVEGEFMGSLADVWLFEVNNTGEIINQKLIGGSEGETIYDIKHNGNDEYLLSGFIRGTDYYGSGSIETGADFWLLSMDNSLDTLWTWKNGGTDSDMISSITIDNGAIITAGRTASTDSIISNSYGARDVWIAKFDYTTTIANNSHGNPGLKPTFYPNPAFTWLSISGANYIRVLDLNGREILSLSIGSSYQELSFPGQLHPGVYLIEMHSNNSVFIEKLIIAK